MIRVRQSLGKYRIEKRLATGGSGTVFRAFDTVTGIPVAIKAAQSNDPYSLAVEDLKKEVRICAKLDHPHILQVKDAGYIEGVFVVVYPLGEESLADRIARRVSARTAVSFTDQMLDAVAYAHHRRVMHCDIKPENVIVFPNGHVRLTDFGIARVASRTMAASGSGTVGYIAPEQAMGRPSPRSDVFSLGLVIYRLFSGELPEWPFRWPMPGHERLRRSLHPDFITFLRKSLEVDSRQRYADAGKMHSAFRRLKTKALRATLSRPARKRSTTRSRDWRTIRHREFKRRFRRVLALRGHCQRCGGPVAESMHHCPWCIRPIRKWREATAFPARCPRCQRGVKTDWRFCPWCYGAAINAEGTPRYADARYTHHCRQKGCPGGPLMPYMKYCPWCRRKVDRNWKIEDARDRCPSCGWGVLPEFWDGCPWCGRKLRRA